MQTIAESNFRVELRELHSEHDEKLRESASRIDDLEFEEKQLRMQIQRANRSLEDLPGRYKVRGG